MIGLDDTKQNGEWGQISHGDLQANVMGDYAIALKTLLFAVLVMLMIFIILFKTTRVIPAEKGTVSFPAPKRTLFLFCSAKIMVFNLLNLSYA